MTKLYRALDGRIDAHSQLKCLLWGFVWEHLWACLLISSFISSQLTAVTGAARTRPTAIKKSGITEHGVVTYDRSPGVETESEVS